MKGNKLKAKVIERGMSIGEFASCLGMNRSSVYRMMSNPKKITIDKAARIKETLKMTNEEAVAIFFS